MIDQPKPPSRKAIKAAMEFYRPLSQRGKLPMRTVATKKQVESVNHPQVISCPECDGCGTAAVRNTRSPWDMLCGRCNGKGTLDLPQVRKHIDFKVS